MIDQEIRDALKVDPSPEFLARVRTRIADEPEPSTWRWSLTFAAAAALAAAVVIAIALTPQRKPEVAQGLSPAIASGPTSPAVQQPTAEQPAPVAQSLSPASAEPVVSGRTVGSKPVVSGFSRSVVAAAPEILLDPAEMRALRGLIAGVREGRVDLAAAQNSAPPPPMELATVADIDIAPITIDPIAPLSGAEGVRP